MNALALHAEKPLSAEERDRFRSYGEQKLDGMPSGFDLRSNGVWRTAEDAPDIWVCAALRVVAMARTERGDGWGRLIEFFDDDGRAQRIAIPARMFAGEGVGVRELLLDRGLQIASTRKGRAYLLDLLQQWCPKARATSTERLGWTDASCTSFALGDGRVIGDAQVVFQSEAGPGAAMEMHEKGTVADWRDTVGAACRGNLLLTTSVSLALTAPLLEMLGLEGGGLHLRGASSAGKSTVLRVATSVWGSRGLMSTWRATANGLEGVAATCNGTLLALDELGEVEPAEAGKAAYMLCNGIGKTRSTRAGGGARPSVRWRTCVLSSGEISVADKMAEAGKRAKAGQEVRLLDIAADDRQFGAFDELHGQQGGAAFAEHLDRVSSEHYGTVGPAFVRALLDQTIAVASQTAGQLINAFRERASAEFGDDGQTSRAARRFALIAAAGEMATAFGLTGWKEGEAADAAIEVMRVWLRGRGGSGPGEAKEAIERTRKFLIEHGASRFEQLPDEGCSAPQRAVHHRAGWSDGDVYYIAADVWRSEVHSGSDHQHAAKHVLAAGYIHEREGDRLTTKLGRSVRGRPRAYAISSAILGEDEP
ncbi:MAG: DUF927 domain-containing protein [Pseudomonadota bacterium]